MVGARTASWALTGLLAGGSLGLLLGLSLGRGELTIAGLSHMGKHGPMILVRPEGPSEAAVQYLDRVRPSEGAPNDQLNNHGWILGGVDQIRWGAQADIDILLEKRASGE